MEAAAEKAAMERGKRLTKRGAAKGAAKAAAGGCLGFASGKGTESYGTCPILIGKTRTRFMGFTINISFFIFYV